MDYKYIEQLLERYWACETSLEEEGILKAFFHQADVPAHLKKYKALFDYEETENTLGSDFDDKVCKIVADKEKNRKPIVRKMSYGKLRPLYRAAAVVAVVALIGNAAQHSFDKEEQPAGWDYNSQGYTDTYKNPQTAYEESMEALKIVQDGLKTASVDSASNHLPDTAQAVGKK